VVVVVVVANYQYFESVVSNLFTSKVHFPNYIQVADHQVVSN
jgi:hypothetical protein